MKTYSTCLCSYVHFQGIMWNSSLLSSIIPISQGNCESNVWKICPSDNSLFGFCVSIMSSLWGIWPKVMGIYLYSVLICFLWAICVILNRIRTTPPEDNSPGGTTPNNNNNNDNTGHLSCGGRRPHGGHVLRGSCPAEDVVLRRTTSPGGRRPPQDDILLESNDNTGYLSCGESSSGGVVLRGSCQVGVVPGGVVLRGSCPRTILNTYRLIHLCFITAFIDRNRRFSWTLFNRRSIFQIQWSFASTYCL